MILRVSSIMFYFTHCPINGPLLHNPAVLQKLSHFNTMGIKRDRVVTCPDREAGESMCTVSIGGKTVSFFPANEPGSPVIYLNTVSGEGQQVFEAARVAGCPPFTLVAISGLDWNRDMAPWDGPAAFKKGEPFTGGADDYLRLLVEEIIPKAEKELAGPPAWRGIAGYSLAGPFALYAIYRTDVFSRVGCMSGSLWFPGFKEYVFSHEPKRWPDCIYFSLGDKEAKTRNPLLKTVHENTEAIRNLYQGRGIDTVFQSNPGNHFVQGIERTIAGIQWLLSR